MLDHIYAITKSILGGDCVFFLGSGLATEAGMLNVTELVGKLGNDLPSDKSSPDLRSVAQTYANLHSEISLKKLVQDEIEKRLETKKLDLTTFDLLAQIPRVHFITTNWDLLLETKFKPSQIRVIFRPEEVPFWDSKRQNLLKMHGSLAAPATIVITQREYDNYRHTYAQFARKIHDLLITHTFVICGYSLQDSTFRDIFLEVNQGRRTPPHNVFWVDPYASGGYVDEWHAYGVKHIDATARNLLSHLVQALRQDAEPTLISNRYTDLLKLGRKALEILKAFEVLEVLEITDFDFFREKLNNLQLIVGDFMSLALGQVDNISKTQLTHLIKIAQKIRHLPEDIELLLNANVSRIRIPNPESVKILLFELAEHSHAKLGEIIANFQRQVLFVEGQPFSGHIKDSEALTEIIDNLVGTSGLRRFTSLLTLLKNHREDLIRYLEMLPTAETQKKHLLKELWGSFDLVLLNEITDESTYRSELLRSILSNSPDLSVKRMALTLRLHAREVSRGRVLDIQYVEEQLGRLEESDRDRRVVLRCLTFHAYNPDIRTFAANLLDLGSLWVLLANERLPIYSAVDFGKQIFREENQDYEKILFDLKYNELEGEFTSSASGDRLSYVRRFILLFRNSPILLEDSYYNRYTILIEQANRPDTSEDFPEFMDLLHEVRATERTLVPAYGPAKDTVDAIPKVVQSRLASNVLYFRSFMTSREPKIALKILEGALNQRIIAEVLGSRAANSELLDKIISMPKYLETPAAQKALLFNPHAHRRYVRTALRYLDNLGNHDVIRLANSHDVASEIRQAAKRLATTRGLPGLGKRV